MTNKTKNTKRAKNDDTTSTSTTSENRIVDAANKKTLTLREAIEAITAKHADVTDADMLRKARLQCCNAESRAARSNKIATMSDQDAATFALFASQHDSEAKLASFFSRAIYCQDKLRTIYAALAKRVSLSMLTRNNSTLVVLRELNKNAADRKSLLSALVRDCKMTANTASSQVSSSLIALQHVGIVKCDASTKTYAIEDSENAALLSA